MATTLTNRYLISEIIVLKQASQYQEHKYFLALIISTGRYSHPPKYLSLIKIVVILHTKRYDILSFFPRNNIFGENTKHTSKGRLLIVFPEC